MKGSLARVRHQGRAGAVLVWVVLSLAVLIGVVAINLDGGRLLTERRRVQAAANAAALAAAADLYANYWTWHGQDPQGTARTAALNAAAANGLSADTVTVNIPPASGTFAGQAGHVEVLVQTSLGDSFGQVFTQQELQVRARTVARGLPMRIGIILLAPAGPDAFLNQSPALTVVGAPVIVNSTDPSAYHQASPGVVVARRFDVTGGFVNPGGALVLGRVRTGVRPTPDPLLFLPIPDSAGAPLRSSGPMTVNSPLPTILQPGVYRGGLNITGLSTVVMEPGVYVMEGGGFKVEGAATVTGLEVMVYNTTSSTYSTGPISVTSSGKVVLAAPLSGTYQGITFFQNRFLTPPITISGNGLMTLAGVVYGVKARVTLTSGVAVGLNILGGGYVVDSMTAQGVGMTHVDLKLNPPRVPDVRLVE